MITEQHIIEKMRQAMQRIEQTTGAAQKEQIAAMKAYCELYLNLRRHQVQRYRYLRQHLRQHQQSIRC